MKKTSTTTSTTAKHKFTKTSVTKTSAPSMGNITWDFSDLYYGPEDKKLEQDVQKIERLCKAFAQKYAKENIGKNANTNTTANADYLKNNTTLLLALKDWEKLNDELGSARPLWYLYNMQSIESQNKTIEAKIGLYEPRVTKALNSILFFTLNLGKIAPEKQQKILTDSNFAEFKYFLERIFITAKYNLTEDAEKVVSLMSRPARSMWIDGFEKLLNKQSVKFKGKDVPLSKAMFMIHQLPTKDRRTLNALCMDKLKDISYLAEQEINAVYTHKQISDELRGYKKPYSATIIGYENDEKSIENLVKVVTDNFHISHRFFKLKAKILGLKSLEYCDRAVGVAKKQKPVEFEEAVSILKKSFGTINPRYSNVLENMLATKKIDVNPRLGKRGGAYCSGGAGVPTVVLLNYVPSIDAVLTFAHEMGHAIHTEFSKKPAPLYQNYTISVAEVASTFFENIASEEIYKNLSKQDKIFLLYDRVADSVSTIFRQIACFNFELSLHEEMKAKGALTTKDISDLHNKHMHAYLGPVFKMKESDGYFFEAWSHIRNFFYVYSYAYGELISKALFRKCKKDPSFHAKVDQFLEAGCSMSPEDIFKSIGVDTSKTEFFKEGLKAIEEDIVELEKLLG